MFAFLRLCVCLLTFSSAFFLRFPECQNPRVASSVSLQCLLSPTPDLPARQARSFQPQLGALHYPSCPGLAAGPGQKPSPGAGRGTDWMTSASCALRRLGLGWWRGASPCVARAGDSCPLAEMRHRLGYPGATKRAEPPVNSQASLPLALASGSLGCTFRLRGTPRGRFVSLIPGITGIMRCRSHATCETLKRLSLGLCPWVTL